MSRALRLGTPGTSAPLCATWDRCTALCDLDHHSDPCHRELTYFMFTRNYQKGHYTLHYIICSTLVECQPYSNYENLRFYFRSKGTQFSATNVQNQTTFHVLNMYTTFHVHNKTYIICSICFTDETVQVWMVYLERNIPSYYFQLGMIFQTGPKTCCIQKVVTGAEGRELVHIGKSTV